MENGEETRTTLLYLVCGKSAKRRGKSVGRAGGKGLVLPQQFQAGQQPTRRVTKSANEKNIKTGHELPKVALFFLLLFVKARPVGGNSSTRGDFFAGRNRGQGYKIAHLHTVETDKVYEQAFR